MQHMLFDLIHYNYESIFCLVVLASGGGSCGGAVGMIMCCGGGSGGRGKTSDSTCTKLIRLRWMACKKVYHSNELLSQCPPEQPNSGVTLTGTSALRPTSRTAYWH